MFPLTCYTHLKSYNYETQSTFQPPWKRGRESDRKTVLILIFAPLALFSCCRVIRIHPKTTFV